jgi:uncharacterized protein YeaO (DUF488 family)
MSGSKVADHISTKRAYLARGPDDGKLFLVDRLWPRGVSKERLAGVKWVREVAPSDTLCRWFDHDPSKWEEFKAKYFAELDSKREAWGPLLEVASRTKVTLIFSAKNESHNQAVALREYLVEHAVAGGRA